MVKSVQEKNHEKHEWTESVEISWSVKDYIDAY